MAQVEVCIFLGGQEITRVMRPLRHIDGKPSIKYKRRFWPLINGKEVYLDGIAPAASAQTAGATGGTGGEDPPNPQVVPPAEIEWDRSQRDVIGALPEDRLLVGAGPGTGKTAVACARVSQLIDQDGLEPSRIWLISFTRTAVREIRDRISAYLEDAAAAYAVKIATLDSHAWMIHSGFDEKAKILGAYEENIERVLELIRQDRNVADYIQDNVEHLIVDEAQDIVGVRADLVVEMIRRLSPSCGVSVFADEAQAIYGFADNEDVQLGGVRQPPLSEKIRQDAGGRFRECGLTDVHRTHSPQLLKIFSETRRKVLTAAGEAEDKLGDVKTEVINLAHGHAPHVDDPALAELEDAFILHRKRSEVLLTTSKLMQNGVPHRVRMSGLPMCLMPWLGATLSEYTERDLSRDRFMELWSQKVDGTFLAMHEPHEAWGHLVRIAGQTNTVVEMRRLRQRLGRKQPPAELCHTELGLRGPIVGTIHASKGREADTVHLWLPHTYGKNADQDEEARVVFVGATRGRSRLLVGHGWHQVAGRLESTGRAYCLHTKNGKPRAQFEIGHEGDIRAEGLAGRHLFADSATVRAAQTRILGFNDESASLIAESDRDAEFVYRLRENEQGQCLAVLSKGVNTDLFTIGKAIQAKLGGKKIRPPDTIRHLHARGVRTVVLPPDTPESEKLHEPWRSSGIMLAPLVLGYSTAFFPSVK